MENGLIYIDNNIFPSLLALSDEEQSRGLMYVEPPAPVMTFIYDNPKINKFWMSNTKAPLDIIFCHKGKVAQLCQGKPYSTEIIGNNSLSDMIIELPAGTGDLIGIKIGQDAGLVKPTKNELNIIFSKKYHHFIKL